MTPSDRTPTTVPSDTTTTPTRDILAPLSGSPFFSVAAVLSGGGGSGGPVSSTAAATRILAVSPGPTKDVVSLQAKLLKARKKNELLQELERGTDKDGYPLGQYRKGFFDHLSGKALVISVSKNEKNRKKTSDRLKILKKEHESPTASGYLSQRNKRRG